MPPEDPKRNLVRQWLAKADEDLAVAKLVLSETVTYFSSVGFHAQQAAEKYLKALLVDRQVEFPKTHDLDRLIDLVVDVDAVLAASLRCAAVLTPYGVQARYPATFPLLSAEDAAHAVALAEKVRESVVPLLVLE